MRLVLDVYDRVLLKTTHAREEKLCIAVHNHWSAGDVGVRSFRLAVVKREYVVLRGFELEQPLKLSNLLRHFRGEIVGLRPVFGCVVKLPDVFAERRLRSNDYPGQVSVPRDRRPALVVDAAVTDHLEVLGLMPFARLGVVE